MSASEMFSFKSPSFKKLGLDKNAFSDGELIDLMLNEPRLIRRPVVSIDGESHFGAGESVLRELID
jgi:arsenate reductase/regulatory protein spx